jgi:hypothetical protein
MPKASLPLRPLRKNGTEITIGFGPHYLEAIPMLLAQMRESDTIILEEPHTPGFAEMLRGEMAIDAYFLQVDASFPLFSKSDYHRTSASFSRCCGSGGVCIAT